MMPSWNDLIAARARSRGLVDILTHAGDEARALADDLDCSLSSAVAGDLGDDLFSESGRAIVHDLDRARSIAGPGRISASLSRSLIGRSRNNANTFVTPR